MVDNNTEARLVSDDELRQLELTAYSGDDRSVSYFIGGLVERGRIAEAEQHASKLSEKGFIEANHALGESLYVLEDFPSAVEHLSPEEKTQRYLELATPYASSHRQGYIIAAFDIGDALESQGRHDEAFPWFKRAAEAGHEEAAIALGFAFALGLGVEVDVLEGARWFMRSLEMEPCESTASDEKSWPVDRTQGWADWDLFGELVGPLDLADRIELMRIVSAWPGNSDHNEQNEAVTPRSPNGEGAA